jgi:hypothetical protein
VAYALVDLAMTSQHAVTTLAPIRSASVIIRPDPSRPDAAIAATLRRVFVPDFDCRRVVLVVLDGLRPDAIDAFSLTHLRSLEASGASTRSALTVSPSVTAAAMGSLLSGVAPETHGFRSDRFHRPRPSAPVDPVPAVLRAAGMITSAFLAQPPVLYRLLARTLAQRLGVANPHFVGRASPEIVNAARETLEAQRSGLILFHLPDADEAGHAHGWMSEPYARAARALDDATGMLSDLALGSGPTDTLMIVCADHGGGGVVANDHDLPHPVNYTIPIIMSGAGVRAGSTLVDATLLDIPATILAALRVRTPASYTGRVLIEAVGALEYAA